MTQFVKPELNFSIDFNDMNIPAEALAALAPQLASAHQGMRDIEAGKIKNPDENRKVTHFTDRMTYPKSPLFHSVEKFAQEIREGKLRGATGKKFSQVVINGIGGSALGPQLMQFAINGPYWNELNADARNHNCKIYFVDNTDTAGVCDLLPILNLEETLVVSISKSGGTQETKNNMIAFMQAFEKAAIPFPAHAAAITMAESALDKLARGNGWLAVFEMAESIGGRTSETSIVGHLPAALAGIDFAQFLAGACTMDAWTREEKVTQNPAYFLASSWYIAGNAKGDKNMIIVPYSDRLILFSRYLQQLVMESLGKEFDLEGNAVFQGLNVFGNKGGTDAHAFIQQLHDGRNDFFTVFIEVMKDAMNIPIQDSISMGDYLHGFETGLATALRNRGRQLIQIRIDAVTPYNLGMLIALFERAVAFYAELIHINAFHQPGVQAYKLAANAIIKLNQTLQAQIPAILPFEGTPAQLLEKLQLSGPSSDDVEGILAKFALNPDRALQGFKVARHYANSHFVYTLEK